MMKHNYNVTVFLMLLFFTAQFVGLFLLNLSIESTEINDDGSIEVVYSEPITGRPEMEADQSFSYVVTMIFIGTAILLLLIKFKMFKIWKAWFFFAIFGALSVSFSVIINEIYALILAFILTYFKLYKPNVYIHNATEIFMYSGIAIMLSPMFNVFWGIMLLLAISVYDAIAVWKLKHMITLAKAQAERKMFAGLLIPYTNDAKDETHIEDFPEEIPKNISKKNSKRIDIPNPEKIVKTNVPVANKSANIKTEIPKGINQEGVKSAILGGGDIAFPMLFAGSVMTSLIENGLSKNMAYFQSLIIPVFAGIALFLLMTKGQKDKFYPAMPFITTGCLIGYGIILLL